MPERWGEHWTAGRGNEGGRGGGCAWAGRGRGLLGFDLAQVPGRGGRLMGTAAIAYLYPYLCSCVPVMWAFTDGLVDKWASKSRTVLAGTGVVFCGLQEAPAFSHRR